MDSIFIGRNTGRPELLNLKRANRHNLIVGATGTGKTVMLQGIIEGFSSAGTTCFVADVKGDLSDLAMAGSPQSKPHEIIASRAAKIDQQERRVVIATDAIGDTYDARIDRESGEGSSPPASGRRQRSSQAKHGRQNAAISGAVRC